MKIDIPYWYLHKRHGGTAGHTFGYTTLIAGLGSSLIREGVEITPDADIRLATWMLEPGIDIEAKRTWVYTMWENSFIPSNMLEEVNRFERILVPSTAVKEWFEAGGVTRPVHVVPLAVDDQYEYQHRTYQHTSMTPFRFLWLGAGTLRKMIGHAVMLFRKAFESRTDVELYIKTTVIDKDARVVQGWNDTQVIEPNIILDKRIMSRAELLNLYYSAHAYLHTCSMEGFGLTVAEAMKTGALVIAPEEGGLRDFVSDESAIVMPVRPHQMIVTWGMSGGEDKTFMADAPMPNRELGVNVLRQAVSGYADTAALRRAGSDLISEQFTWERTARRLMDLVRTHAREGVAA